MTREPGRPLARAALSIKQGADLRGSRSPLNVSSRQHTMGSARRRAETARFDGKADKQNITPDHASALEEDVEAVKRWERAILLARSKTEQVSEWIAGTAGSGPVLILHVVWFTV